LRCFANKGCGRKNTPNWEGHRFGWGARRRTAVYVPFSVYTMAWLGEYRAFIVEEFIKKMAGFLDMLSPCVVISGGHAFARFDPLRFFFSGATSEQRFTNNAPVTLEALKEAIR